MKSFLLSFLFVFTSYIHLLSQVDVNIAISYDDSLSYAVGYDVARSIRKMDVQIDKDLMMKGIVDALSDSASKPFLTDEEMTIIFQQLQQKNMQNVQQQQAEQGLANRTKGLDYITKMMAKDTNWKKTQSGLVYKITDSGNNKKPKSNNKIEVKYIGSLIDGQIFDQTNNSSVTFELDGVIPGWTEGMQLIGEGGVIELIIPAELAYGNNPPPGTPIQAGTTLCFTVELLKVK